jgi:acetoin utilization protein AcuC
MSSRRLAFLYSPAIESLAYPDDCPFKTNRASLVRQRLRSFGHLGTPETLEVQPRPATLDQLATFHTRHYLDTLQRAADGHLSPDALHMGLGTPDTPVFKDLFHYSAWAAGAALHAADLLLEARADVAFNLLGGFHHAFPERAAGFCYINDIVLACDRLARAGKRVLCLDVDAHHGDGTQAAFYQRSDVLTISLHESGKTLFPWGGFEDEIGAGPGLGHNVNVSLPPGTYDEAFLHALNRVVFPILHAYDPDMIVLELGMDTLSGDPLTHLHLTNNAHAELITSLLDLHKPILVEGGGGYHIDNTVRAWTLAWQICAGAHDDHDLSLGLGGVMLASSEWTGGLRDHARPVTDAQRRAVEPALRDSIQAAIQNTFRYHHGLTAPETAGPSTRADSRQDPGPCETAGPR